MRGSCPTRYYSRLGVCLVITADALLSSLRHMYSVSGIGLLHGDTTRRAAWLPSYHTIITPISHPQAALERVNQLERENPMPIRKMRET